MDACDGWCGRPKTLHFRHVNEGLTRHMLQTITLSLSLGLRNTSEVRQVETQLAYKVQKPRGNT